MHGAWVPPHRHRAARAVVLTSVVALALLGAAACGRSSGSPPRASPSTGGPGPAADTFAFPGLTTTPTTTATTPVPVATAPAPAPADDLAAATAITPLGGFTEIPAGPGLGLLDLQTASAGEPRERDALSRFGFRDGHRRGFASGAEELVVTVLRFASPADAEAYLRDTVDSSLVGNGSFLFSVPVTGATGYREQGAGDDGQPYVTYGALFTRGDRCYEQLVRSPATGPERTEADAQALARRQADRVGG